MGDIHPGDQAGVTAPKFGLSRAFAIIFLLGTLAFGTFATRLGFYLDDWPLLEIMSRGGRIGAAAAWIRNGGLWTRPVEILQYSLFFLIGGTHPGVQHLLLFATGLLEILLLFLLLDSLLQRRSLALAAAAIAYLYPNRAMFHIWFSDSPQATAHVLALASLLSQLRFRATSRRAWLACSLVLFLAAILSYESVLFLPFAFALAIGWDNRSPSEGAIEAVEFCLPYLLPVLLAMTWQWFGARLLLGHANPKAQGMSITFHHVFRAYGAGFECITNRTLHLCVKNIAAMLGWGWRRWLFGSAGVAVTAVAVRMIASDLDIPRRDIGKALMLSGATFIAGYAPYALSGTYTPQIFGVMSRTNEIGAWSGGLLIAALIGLCRPRVRGLLLPLIAALFLCADWQTNLEWSLAWKIEQDVLTKITPKARELPQNSRVLLAEAPHFVGYAVVFDSSYDFDAALRLATARKDLSGLVAPAECSGCYRYDYSEDRWLTPSALPTQTSAP